MSPVSWHTRKVVSFFFLLLAIIVQGLRPVFFLPTKKGHYAKRMELWLAHFRVPPTFRGNPEPARLGLHPNLALVTPQLDGNIGGTIPGLIARCNRHKWTVSDREPGETDPSRRSVPRGCN
jgi:hypothetical protein